MSSPVSQAERASILEALASADEDVRRFAVEQVLVLPPEEAVGQLIERLGDTDWRVRKAAVERLVACGDQSPVQEMLIASLADGENSGRRNSAFEALVGCGSQVTARLASELTNADADVRKSVIDAIAAIGDSNFVGPLVEAIDDVDANVRAAAVEALGVLGGSQEIERLIEISADCDEEAMIRMSALRALSWMEAGVGVMRLADALDDSLLRPSAYELLGHSADPAAKGVLLKGLSSAGRISREGAMAALLRTLGRTDGREAEDLQASLREAARASLGLIEESCARLKSADLARQMVLIQFLGMIEDPRVIVPILEAGRDEAITELADTTLESMGEIVSTELSEIWDDLDERLKGRVCRVLGRIGGETAERLLVEMLASPDGELRGCAASALGEGSFFDRVPNLVGRLEAAAANDELDSADEISTIVSAIVQLAERPEASEIGIDVQLTEVLSSRLGGAPEPVRLAIAQVLARLGREQDEDVIDYLLKDESASVRRAAVGALRRFDYDRTRDALRLALADESTMVRIAAVKVLGESGRPEAVDELRGLVADGEEKVVAVALRSLGQLHACLEGGADGVYEVIGRALEDSPIIALAGFDALLAIGGDSVGALARSALSRCESDVIRAAVTCLGAHGVESDLMAIIPLVDHVDWSVRAEIIQVFSERAFRKGLPALLRRLEVEDDSFVREVVLRAIGRLEG